MIKKKSMEKEGLSESITNIIAMTEVTWVSSFVNFAKKYMWTMNNADMNVAKKLGLTSIKKYQRRARQYEIELDCLYE